MWNAHFKTTNDDAFAASAVTRSGSARAHKVHQTDAAAMCAVSPTPAFGYGVANYEIDRSGQLKSAKYRGFSYEPRLCLDS